MSNVVLLSAIGAATAAGQMFYVSQEEGLPLINHKPPLIEINGAAKDPNDANKYAARLTEAGGRMVADASNGTNGSKPVASAFQIGTGFVAPKLKRGGGSGGAPTKYPFEGLAVGQHFYVPNSAVDKGDAYKTLSSAVGSANQRYSEPTGETKQVERAKRGSDHKAVKGPDGKNVMETVTVEAKRAVRHFIVRAVKADAKYGELTFPADGAVVVRES